MTDLLRRPCSQLGFPPINEGSFIRVIRAPYFGKVGTVKSLPPELAKMESETLVRVAEIKFEDGSVAIIPRANLEMILI